MSVTTQRIEAILTSGYSNQSYLELVNELFDDVQVVNPNGFNKEFSNFSSHIEGSTHIGNYSAPDSKKLIIVAVRLKAQTYVESSRSKQRSYAKKLIENAGCDAAFIAFYTEGDPKWRLSFVRLDYEMKIENGRLKAAESLTPAKRYSYLVGEGEPCHTAIDRLRVFIDNHSYHPTMDEIEEAFSVEKVTDEFFQLYCEKYHQIREHLESCEDFVIEAEQHNFTSAQFAKKLMGQIVFLYFLQKKGWLGVSAWPRKLDEKSYKNAFYARGAKSRELIPIVYRQGADGMYNISGTGLDSLDDADEAVLASCVKGEPWGTGPHKFMRRLFEVSDHRKANFYEDYLEPLFYEALNVNRGEQGYCAALHCRIPFLSGGLFEPIDGYEWKHNNFNLPNSLFSEQTNGNSRTGNGILDIFDRYNFTMSEDEPMEREVAIDPEMLGKVFENLLEVNDRKSKGAFYTPREIVHYMCQESLINYLARTMILPDADIRDFILYGDFMKDEDTSKDKRQGNNEMYIAESLFRVEADGSVSVNRLYEMDAALASVRVADPAVGSGAFPLGILNEIVRARQNITEYLLVEKKSQVKASQQAFVSREMHTDRSAYRLKYETVKNCIFAADIEPSAVDIAQLRLWLSLVIDDEITPDAQTPLDGHRNPLPLPNLECNILCGNSLVDEFAGIRLINESDLIGNVSESSQLDINQPFFDATLRSLLEAQDELFRCDNTERKEEIKRRIEGLRDIIISKQLAGCSEETLAAYQESKSYASKPYILWQLDFGRVFKEKGGFDIVIGNPPYIGESGHKEIFREVAATEFGSRAYQGKMDFFYFFFHKGLDILHTSGDLGFITTNYYPTATGAKRLRMDFAARTYIRQLINFNEVRVFESALGQHNMITLLTKNKAVPFECKSIMCSGSYTASSEQLRLILNCKATNSVIRFIQQDNVFDGVEYYIRQEGVASSDGDSIGSVIDKMATQNRRLGDIAEVNQGVVSGCDYVSNRNISDISDTSVALKDGIFVLDMENPRDREIFASFSDEEKKLFRPFYKNSEVSRYHCNLCHTKVLLYLSKKTESLDNYPKVLSHLHRFWPVLQRRREAQTGAIKPFQLQWARTEAIFLGKKIVVPYRTKENSFAYNDVEWFCRSDAYVITAKSESLDLFYLLGVLNSKLTYAWLYNRGKRKGEVLELFQVPLSEIPIIELGESERKRISELARTITEEKKSHIDADTRKAEAEIDLIIYKAYDLTDAEIAIIKTYQS